MSNKVSNHKLTVLSVSLLVLFLGGCGGGSGGVNTGATNGPKAPVVSIGSGTGSDGAGGGATTDGGVTAGTDGSATTDGGVTPPKPEVKTPELEKVDNPNVPKKDLLGAEKPYTELSGYSFNAGFQGSIKETKGLLAEEESEGKNGKEKLNFNSAIKTGADGQPFEADPTIVGEQRYINSKERKNSFEDPKFNREYYQSTRDDTQPKSYMARGAKEENWLSADGDVHQLFIQNFGNNVNLGAMQLTTSPGIKENVFFYRGDDTTSFIPTSGKVVYYGAWLYATKAFNDTNNVLQSGEYKEYLDSGETKTIPTIKLTADFTNKVVTGNFNQAVNSGGDQLALTIPEDKPAKITANGFSGHAVVTVAQDTNNPNHYNELPVGSEVDVTGAFYGGNVNSIGGYLHKGTGEEQVFAGVFAGKSFAPESHTEGTEDVRPAKNNLPYVDSILKIDQASGDVDLSTPQFTGDIDKLNLGDNVGVSLGNITDTGIDFQFLRLSNFAKDDSGYKFNQASLGQNGDTGYFIQGYLTPDSDMNKLVQTYSKVYYAGKWLGWGKSDDNTTSAHYADARYVFDFNNGDKVLNGYLYKPGSTNVSTDVKEDIKKAEESVRSKTFEGIALYTHVDGNSFRTNDSDHTSKINLDGVTGEVKAEGHFFGTQANPGNEIGGTVVGVGDTKFGGVFAGKQVKGVSEKR